MRPALASVTLVAALLTGCGTASSPTPAAPGTGAATTATPSPSSTTGPGSAFPLDITRTGGIAGFSDRVVVQSDGRATISTRQGPPSNCRVTPGALRRLEQAVTALAAAPARATTSPPVADDLVTTLRSPATGSALRLSDAPTAAVAVVGDLLAEVRSDPADRTLCPPG